MHSKNWFEDIKPISVIDICKTKGKINSVSVFRFQVGNKSSIEEFRVILASLADVFYNKICYMPFSLMVLYAHCVNNIHVS